MTEKTELTVIERAAVALGADEGEKQLIALAKKYTDITDIKNPAGRTQCHAAAMELSNARIHVDKTGKAAREDANAFQKAVIAEVARRVAIIKPEEDRLLALRDDWDEARAAEKAAIAAAEKARVDGIRNRIASTHAIPARLVGQPSHVIAGLIDDVEAVEITLEEWAEFAGEAQAAQVATIAKLREMLVAQQAVEAEQVRLKAEREEMDLRRLQLAAQERKAAEARAEEERKVREARAAEEARLRAIREAEEAAHREAQAKAAAAMREQQEAHEKRMREQQAEIDRQQAEIDRAREEQERVAREAREAAEAEARAKQEAIESEAARIAQAEADRIFAEQERIAAERKAAVAEQIRREQEQFAANGPGDVEIVKLLAHQYDVTVGDVMGWMKKFDYSATDELLAAENVAANRLEKAA